MIKRTLSLLLALVLVLGMIPTASAANTPVQPLGIEEYPVLEYEVDLSLTLGDSEFTYVAFTPEQTGPYNFHSKGTIDAYARLYDSQMNFLDIGDDCWDDAHGHDSSVNFCITTELQADQTYILGVADYAGHEAPVTIRVGCGHSYESEIITDAGCDGASEVRYTCTLCGSSHIAEVYLGHDFEAETTKQPTCEEDGVRTFTCRKCGLIDEYPIDALGHDFDENLICTRCKQPPATSGTWEQLSWKVENGVLTITGEGEMPDGDRFLNMYTDYDYNPNPLFMYLPITEIVVGEGITSVSGGAFMGCTQLKKVTLPSTITSIGQSAFEGCGALTSITLPDSVEYIDRFAFQDCDLRRFHIPANAQLNDDYDDDYSAPFIGNDRLSFFTVSASNPYYSADSQGAVYSKDKTELVILPNGYTGSFTIPASVSAELPSFARYTGLEAIHVADGSPYYYSVDGVLFSTVLQWCTDEETWTRVPEEMGTQLLYYPASKKGSTYSIPTDVEKLSYYSFADNRYLQEVTIPAGCTDGTLQYAFSSAAALENIHVEEGNASFYSIDGMLFESHIYNIYDPITGEFEDQIALDDMLLFCPRGKDLGDYTLGSHVTGIGDSAFNDCTGLTELTIPATCVDLAPADCLYNCTSLQAVWFAEDHPEFWSTEDGVVINRNDIIDHACDETFRADECLVYFPTGRTGHYAIPEGITYLGEFAMLDTRLSGITFPTTFRCFGSDALESDSVRWMLFTGEHPYCSAFMDAGDSCQDVTADVYYPQWKESWTYPQFAQYADDLTFIPYAEGEEPVFTPFTDVPAGAFYEEPVLWAIENNITNGLTEDTFGPTATCNRAQVVTFLWRAAGCPEPTSAENPFVDVQSGGFYEKPVLWAVEKGITNGSDATHFNPTGVCNRAQVVTFLYRAFESPAVSTEGLPFTDVPAGSWYEAPIAWAVENNITNGLDATHFGPDASCNRAQVVTFLYRAYN